ncbi:glutaminase ['Osedax' symbiont bacterium Rs2_46_30_T18]|nr:glutaminase ['Osedax' symbiont bacterium Rs2_46_30_T18]
MSQVNYQAIFSEIIAELQHADNLGEVASYIPELAHVDANKLGIHLTTLDNSHFSAGDAQEKFSIQSISKVLSLTLAFSLLGSKLWSRVGVEPSGSAFNSLVQLEYERGIPRNPFINAGAIVVCDVLISLLKDPKKELLAFIRKVAGSDEIHYNERVAVSEILSGHRNYALIHLMRDFGNIHNDVEDVLDLYFYLCSIEMSCSELSGAFTFLASNGINRLGGDMIVSPSKAKRINTIMQLCGFYDEAGEFSFRVGLPGKSGVGGGIVAVHPGKYSIAVWSPKLNKKGNSYLGMKVLEMLTSKTESSIF